MIYCTQGFKLLLVDAGIKSIDLQIGDMAEKAILFSNMEVKDDNTGLYPVVVSDSTLGMRGDDYRAPNVGLNFFQFASFDNETDALQARGRVGRNDDPCTRYQLQGMPPVDATTSYNHEKALLMVCVALKAKKED